MAPTAADFKKPQKDKEKPLTAVVVIDAFDQRFAPILENEQCFGFVPLCNVPMIHYTLTWLMRTGIDNVMIVVTGKNAKYAQIIDNDWRSAFEEFTTVVCDGATSLGDCLREIHNRELITDNFLLISNPSSLTSSTLSTQISEFRKRRSENADNVMTLIYGSCENREKCVVGVNADKKLVLYPAAASTGLIKVDKPDFYQSAQIRRDVVNTGIALCSRLIVTQFNDNFDFLTMEDVIRELLSKDDILGLNIHVEVLPPDEAAYLAKDYDTLLHLNTLLLERWFYPITPEKSDALRIISVGPRNVYVEESDFTTTSLSSRVVLSDPSVNVSLGISTKVSKTAKIYNSSIGSGSTIGNNSTISNCIIGKNTKIGENVEINGAFIGDNVVIPDGTQLLNREIIIGNNVELPKSFEYIANSAVCHSSIDEEEYDRITSKLLDKVHVWSLKNGSAFWKISSKGKTQNGNDDEDSDEEFEDDSDQESESFDDGFDDSTRQFYEEVYESMKGMLTMANQQMNNLILEINSSKLACNVTLDDVARNVFAAFLALPGNDDPKNLLLLIKKWRQLFVNYYKSSDANANQRKLEMERKCQIQMLMAIEDKYEKEPDSFGPKCPKLVHFLYNDADVLDEEAILEWASSLPDESELKSLMQPIVDWLEEDDDDSDA